MRRAAPLLLAAALLGCVSVEPEPPRAVVIQPDQRTLVLVFAAPGPWVGQSDTKVDSAAKIVPGIGLMWQGSQDEHALRDSNDLARYLPGWSPAGEFYDLLRADLDRTGYPGRWLAPAETDIPQEVLERFNRASDVLRWRQRFYHPEPNSLLHLRNYSSLIELDDALVFEVNILYGVTGLGTQVHPYVETVARLFKASTMRLLWENTSFAEDADLVKHIYDFKVEPAGLKANLSKLLPLVSGQIAAALRRDVIEKSIEIQRRLDALAPGGRAGGPKKETTGTTPAQ